MILDGQLAFSDSQSLVGAAATTVSTNTVDLLDANNDYSIGDPVRVFVNIVAALTGGTSVKAQIIQSDSANLSSPTVLYDGAVFADAAALAGVALLDVRLPATTKRYLGVQYVTLGTHAAGTVDAHVAKDVPHRRYLPANYGR